MGIQAWVLRRAEPEPAAAAESAQPGVARPASARVQIGETDRDASVVQPGVAELDWSGLEARVAACRLCSLHTTRTRTVFGSGARDADWMIIGEGPGAEEDRQGEPFVGPAGHLLNNMLRALDLTREAVYIANIVKCRPPGNRDPQPEEAAACRAYLERQIALVRPRLILAVGRVAAQNLLETTVPVGKLRGRVHRYGAAQRPLIVTYHPAYLLRSPEHKAQAWEDLQLARGALEGHP
ncbi:uracil-DNA glycosylase [Acidihalobacter ferrooxydans]|uniref:Type-4 uracil-DNA glycosylase n=1 Tax=Acidihalobacter ferrooxydans TaxID=1765967 RepID=A0A1P8UKX2_9GAMM|nr:uracil-DNA glycosylase [Acidihalobacter ferrooxydans]APZ44496.1 hypothetical protein BW247_02355 [Acidihalobacter ferrooxydans]